MNPDDEHAIERVLPQNTEAEAALLGSLMILSGLNQEVMDDVLVFMDDTAFYRPDYAAVFRALKAVYARREAEPCIVTLRDELVRQGNTGETCELDFLTSLTDSVGYAGNGLYYARMVFDAYRRREGIRVANEGQAAMYDPETPIDDALAAVQGDFSVIAGQSEAPSPQTLREVFEDALRDDESNEGLSLPWPLLSDRLNGMRPGELIVLGGATGMGKTAFVLNIACYMGTTLNKPVTMLTLEMKPKEIGQRLLSHWSKIPLSRVIKPSRRNEDDNRYLDIAMSELAEVPIHLESMPRISISKLERLARQWRDQKHIELLVIDYLQQVSSSTKQARFSRVIEVGDVIRRMKELAMELEIPIIALSQLNRGAGVGSRLPRMSDLRESGEIENYGNAVLLLHRQDYYDKQNGVLPTKPGELDVVIAKQRNGPGGLAHLAFDGKLMRIDEPEQPRGDRQ